MAFPPLNPRYYRSPCTLFSALRVHLPLRSICEVPASWLKEVRRLLKGRTLMLLVWERVALGQAGTVSLDPVT
jgi:hypothetical protein